MRRNPSPNRKPMPAPVKRMHLSRFSIAMGIGALLTVLIVFIIYKPGLNGPLILDDIPQLGSFVDTPANQIWSSPSVFLFSSSGPLGRPISMLSFALGLETGVNPTHMWKLTNVMLHVINGGLLFWLTLLLFGKDTTRRQALPLSAACAFLWLLHPLHVSTVLYTVQRMSLLANLFMLAGMIFYIYGRRCMPNNGVRSWSLLGMAFIVCFPLAVLSKELALIFPVFCALIEYLYFHQHHNARIRRQIRVLFALMLVLPALIGSAYLAANFERFFVDGYLTRDFTLYERLLTQPRVISLYLLQTLLPIQSLMGFIHDDIAVSSGLLNPISTLGSITLLAFFAYVAWHIRKRHRIVTFALLAFLFSHLMEGSIFALELMFEHRNYLGSFFVLLTLAYSITHLITSPSLPPILSVCTGLILAFILSQRVATWSSEQTLTKFMLATHPQSERLFHSHLRLIVDSGDYSRAKQILGNRDRFRDRLQHLYIGCKRDGHLSTTDFDAARPGENHYVGVIASGLLIDIANLGLDGVCKFPNQSFIVLLNQALDVPVLNALIRYRLLLFLAHYHREEGKVDAAVRALLAAYDAVPTDALPLLMSADWLHTDGQHEGAREMLAMARAAANQSPMDYSGVLRELERRIQSPDGN